MSDIVCQFRASSIQLCSQADQAGCAINLPDAITLGGTYDGDGASPVGLQNHTLLQWAVNLQQQRRWRRLFVLKAEVATHCVHLASAGAGYMCPNRNSAWLKGRR